MYVVGKDMAERAVRVAEGGSHPALFTHSAVLAAPHWVSGAPPPALEQARSI